MKTQISSHLFSFLMICLTGIGSLQAQTPDTTAGQDRVYKFTHSHHSYILIPSAYGMRQGEAYFRSASLVAYQIQYGLSDHVTVSGGVEALSLLTGKLGYSAAVQLHWPVAKRLRASAMLSHVSLPILAATDDNDPISQTQTLYGMATYGTPDRHITAGIGWGMQQRRENVTQIHQLPTASLSAQYRVTNRLALVGEGVLVPYNQISGTGYETRPVLNANAAVRILGTRTCMDMGFLLVNGIGLPYLGIGVYL